MLRTTNKQEQYKDELLEAWEETYKKGQLTLWIFLALKESEKFVDDIKKYVESASGNTLTCEEQSLYRTLRKYKELEMVDYNTKPGDGGPERKYYYLTKLGEELLQRFCERNIKLFFQPQIKNLMFKN